MNHPYVLVTACGALRAGPDGAWIIEDGDHVEAFTSLVSALQTLADRCDESSSGYSIEYRAPIGDLLQQVEATGESAIFDNSDDGWTLLSGHWIPNHLRPGGDAERVALLVEHFGDMGVHVELYDYDGIYVMRWSVADVDDEGIEVLGALSREEATSLAEAKAGDVGFDTGLSLPDGLGLANLEAGEHPTITEDAVLAARASSAWPYDPSERVNVDIYLSGSGNDGPWLIAAGDPAQVIGTYPSWEAIKASMSVPDGWEIEVDWFVDEPEA